MIRTGSADGETISYSTRDMAVLDLSKQILKYLEVPYQTGASANGPTISISTSRAHDFEREVKQWREAAAKLVILPPAA